MAKQKYMDIKEFQGLGYIQEINRLLLHPAGLALEIQIDLDTGEMKINGIQDNRDDPAGMFFDLDISEEELADMRSKALRVGVERLKKYTFRKLVYGVQVQELKPPPKGILFKSGITIETEPDNK